MGNLTSAETLQVGIEAARAGHPSVARQHLTAVLKDQPDNVPALLWLAYLAPNPHDSLRLLNRVLTLNPTNEGARAGIHWARRRLTLASGEFGSSPRSQVRSLPQPTPPIARRKTKHQSKPTISRRRYAFTTLLVFIVVGLLGLVIGLGTPLFIPPETLAAWVPAVDEGSRLVIVEGIAPATMVEPTSEPQSTAVNLSSASDTIFLASPRAGKSGDDASAPEAQIDLDAPVSGETQQPTTELPVDDSETVAGVAPSLLIGPALPVDPAPVDPAQLAHQPAYPGEKWIEVNVTTQEVTAWEGNVPVLSFITSTGLPDTPTVLGEYNIYWKLEKTLMTGPGYYLPDVPYTMYFYQGYALHGTYWHDNFGQPMSRGCVNLSIDNSKKLFEWADPVIPPGETAVWATPDNPGTLVVVHQ